MSTVKHTPGPWYQREQGSEIEIKAGIYTICMVHNYNEPHEVNEANAKLITQSPTMKQLLIEEVEYLDMWIGRIATPESLMSVEMNERKEFILMTLKATS